MTRAILHAGEGAMFHFGYPEEGFYVVDVENCDVVAGPFKTDKEASVHLAPDSYTLLAVYCPKCNATIQSDSLPPDQYTVDLSCPFCGCKFRVEVKNQ